MKTLANITAEEFRGVLKKLGLRKVRTKGGHEAWMKEGMTRPVIVQTHTSPIPEFILRNGLRNLGLSKQDFIRMLD